MRKFITFGPALVVLLTVMVVLVAAPAAVRSIGLARTEATIHLAQQTLDTDNILKAIDRATRAIADSVEPSVVHISVQEPSMRRGGWTRVGQGSGWVFDEQGHIVTNAHVVRGASRITVQFQDGRAVQAEIVGHDASTDIAVIKVPAGDGLFPIRRASGTELHQGERVYAFGSPFGFKFSMSEGIVSGLGRDPEQIVGSGGFTNFIQTDAAVNPGNSGGPLVNVEGRLVGMNVAIATAPQNSGQGEGQNSGISFAIPLATIESVVEQLISGGVVAKGYFGIERSTNEEENAALLARAGFKGRGVFVKNVYPDSPASKAGLGAGDVITRINDRVIATVPVLRSAIANNVPGEKVRVEVWRSGESKVIELVVGNLPPTAVDLREALTALREFGLVRLTDVPNNAGVEIGMIQADSKAMRAGLRPEQRIVAVDGKPVADGDAFLLAVTEAGLQNGRDVTVTIESLLGQRSDVTLSPR